MVRAIILVGLGGGIGSILRYLISLLLSRHFSFLFPWATFAVNITGCFLLGLLLGLFEQEKWTEPDLKFIFVVGFCGGYTTFSTFAVENIALLQSNHILLSFAYIAFSVFAGLVACWMGLWIIK